MDDIISNTFKDDSIHIMAECIICSEIVPLTATEEARTLSGKLHYTPIKVCDKCKNAIMFIRDNKETISSRICKISELK